ncbi:serine/threonine-protein kinase [Polyangium jinanense]|uniref:Serine/threonine-protein kinase n=1 Tax=Polyangium jinanense TaxID=2829994 RepID=A0A9X3X1G3_9BACT|nr:serine/threonine-protein kinase [Polyangium jinanense]MDC3954752.1 serine/threonine-protein kinase [Polyangium jinanense]MDC3961900.1 serine/threonine-protein kinase [Polyangium jinanense]MDC3981055.1 serine/threonine-protein kinase [Polyangium jinanense]
MSSALPEAVRRLTDLPDAERRIGAFWLVRQLGRGGFAPVWLAEETAGTTKLRLSAVKLFSLDAGGEAGRQAIIDEAARLCRVEHPNVVRFYQLPVDETRGVIGLAMEYVAGESLGERLRDKQTLSVRETIDAGIAIASALVAVHGAGLVHRDISPANVVVDAALLGTPAAYKLIDFGISAASTATPGQTIPSMRSKIPSAPSTPRDRPSDRGFRSPLEAIGGKRGFVDPVCWRALSPATSASDLYALGAVLFVCLVGRTPAAGRGSLDEDVLHGRKEPPRLAELVSELPASLGDLVDALLAPEPEGRPRSAEIVAIELERIRSALVGRRRALPPEEDGPFRGLERFEKEHRDVFFGRRVEVAAALEVLRTRGLAALLGPSGSGKSSLARAGILPAIADGALGGPRQWETVLISPGTDPRQVLTTALFHMGLDPKRSPEEAAARVEAWLSQSKRGLVLLVDQLEEIATLAQGPGGKSQTWTLDLLARLGERPWPGLRVVVTARRDLLDPILAHEQVGRVITRGAVLVSPLGSAAWGEVIDAAFESYGYTFEDPRLRKELLEALETTAGSMPLVEFALRELWHSRDRARKLITRSSLRAIEFSGALSRHANETMDRAVKEAGTERMVQRILLSLTTPAGARMTRRIGELVRELGPAARAVVQVFAEARLVLRETERRKDGEVELVTLAHEALLVHWGKLRDWVASEREERLVIEDFEEAAKVWEEKPDPELLWRRRRLLLLEEILRARQMRLEGAAKRFYAASVAAAQRSRIIGGVVGILAGAIALGAGTVYVDLEAQRAQAEADTAMAKAEAALALAREAKAQADRERAVSGQKEAEKREAEAKAALTALKLVQGSLTPQTKASPSEPKEPTALDSSVVRQLDEYLVKQERDNAKLPEPLEDLLRETEHIPPPVVEPGLTGPVTALPQPRGGPVARSVVLGEAYSKLSQAKVVAASCKREDEEQPKGNGKVALVLDPKGTVSAVSLDERFVGTKVGACVDRAFRQVIVQPFEGKPLTVIWSFAIP